MRAQFRTAAIVTAILVGTAGGAHAQGSITQDPGKITPGNLTTQQLGPSVTSPSNGGNGTLGAGDLPNGNWTGAAPSPGATGAMPGYGTSSSRVGAGNRAVTGGSPSGNHPTPTTGPDR